MTERQIRRLLERFLRRLHSTGALSVPPSDLEGLVDQFVHRAFRTDRSEG